MVDPLPDADLHNLLNEFIGVIPGTQSSSPTNHVKCVTSTYQAASSPLTTQIPLREDGLKYDESVKRGVAVKWILGVSCCPLLLWCGLPVICVHHADRSTRSLANQETS
jgi:hypothetical protein